MTDTATRTVGTTRTDGAFLVRRVRLAQFAGSTVDGAVLATAVLYFSTRVGVSPATIGVVLAVAATCALVLSVPIGLLADAVGLVRAGVALSALVAVALGVYAVAGNVWTYAVGAVCFAVAQAGIGAVRQAIVAAAVPPEHRVRSRAVLHTLLNAGMGLGTVWGAVVLGFDAPGLFVTTFGLGAAAALGCAVLFAGLPHGADTGSAARRPGLTALTDTRFVLVTVLSALLQLTMPVLSVILPLWVSTRTGAPQWVAAVALALNTVLVMAGQTPWAARVTTDATARRSAACAGVSLLVACALVGAAGGASSALTATALVLCGVTALTLGEISAGAATWYAAFRAVPDHAHGQYQAVFGMAASLARIVGPSVALPLVLAAGSRGWLALGGVMAVAAAALAIIVNRHGTPDAQRGQLT
jgi:MFS family permease